MAEKKSETRSFVTTNTGRILRVDAQAADETAPAPVSPAPAAPVTPHVDPARREDVLFRVRRDHGHEMSVWWPISAFLITSTLVVILLGWVPGGA